MSTLTQIKKDLKPDTCSDVKHIMKMFIHICENNPEAVKASFSPRMQADRPDMMVKFYRDNAEYLKELFNYD